MVELLLKRYLWLIDTLKRGGEMTFDEIAAQWSKSSVNDNGSELSKRTFYNHCQAVARHFGIDIECRRGRGLNLYGIANPEAIEENSFPIFSHLAEHIPSSFEQFDTKRIDNAGKLNPKEILILKFNLTIFL